MANSKRSAESQAFLQSLQVVLPLLQANPGVFDNINADAAVRTIMAANGVNPKMMRTEQEVAQIRTGESPAGAAGCSGTTDPATSNGSKKYWPLPRRTYEMHSNLSKFKQSRTCSRPTRVKKPLKAFARHAAWITPRSAITQLLWPSRRAVVQSGSGYTKS